MPTVSIIIPCFNRERFIAEAVDSALAQDADVEVIVIDDGSTDDSWPLIQRYGARIRVERQANRGVGSARNKGVALARGHFIQFLDSDDRLSSNAVSRMLAAATDLAPREIALGQITWMDEAGTLLKGGETISAPNQAEILGSFIGNSQPLYPAEALRSTGGFVTHYRNHEDHELAVRLLGLGYRYVAVPVVICEARVHSGARLSQDRGKDRFRHRLEVLEAITAHVERASLGADAAAVHARLLWSVGRQAARAGEQAVAERLFQLAWHMGGSRAIVARWPVRVMQRMLGPYRGERIIKSIKALTHRESNF